MSRLSAKFIRSCKRIRHNLKIKKKDPSSLRLCVFKSNKFIYVQAIDDAKRHTVASASSNSKECRADNVKPYGMAGSEWVGKRIAEVLREKNVTKVVFDRSGWKMHGCVKMLADTARKYGLVK